MAALYPTLILKGTTMPSEPMLPSEEEVQELLSDLELILGITDDDPSLANLLDEAAKDSPETVFYTEDRREINYQLVLNRDMSPEIQVWFRAYLLDLRREQDIHPSNITLGTFLRILAQVRELDMDVVNRQIKYKSGRLALLNYPPARSAIELTPEILIEDLHYTVPEAFLMLSKYFSRNSQDLIRSGHHQLIMDRITWVYAARAAEAEREEASLLDEQGFPDGIV